MSDGPIQPQQVSQQPPLPPPEKAPSEMAWWQRTWGVVLIAVIALILGAAAGVSGKKSKTETKTVTVQGQSKVVVQTKTVTVHEEAKPPPKEEGAASSGGGGTHEFSGNGGKNLGKITVPTESTLEWTNDGGVFQIFTNEGVPVNSQAHSGSTVLEEGTYSKFQVNAVGNWTIKIVPK